MVEQGKGNHVRVTSRVHLKPGEEEEL